MRYIILALDIAGAVLFTAGACGLAFLVHPYLSLAVAGTLCLAAAFLLEPRRKAGDE